MSLSVRLGAVAALLVAGSAEAGQLVCKDKIIDTGTTAAELLAACGEPVSRTVETATVRDAGARGAGDAHPSRPGATNATAASSRPT